MSARRCEELLATIRRQGGRWTTSRVSAHYRTAGIAPGRTTARDDLHRLAAQGRLTAHGPDNDRVYTLTGDPR